MATSDIRAAATEFVAADATIIVGGRILLGVAAILLWEFYPEIFGVNQFWLSRPSLIWTKAVELHREGVLLSHIGVTVAETLIGQPVGEPVHRPGCRDADVLLPPATKVLDCRQHPGSDDGERRHQVPTICS